MSLENWYYEICFWLEEDGKFFFKEYMIFMYEVMYEFVMEILCLIVFGFGLLEGVFIYLFDDKLCFIYWILYYFFWDGFFLSNVWIEDGKIFIMFDYFDLNFFIFLVIFNYKGLEIVNLEGNWVVVELRFKSFVMNIGDFFD